MIKKFTKEEIESVWMKPVAGNIQSIYDKINELIDTVNAIQKEREAVRFEIQEWIGILEAVRKSVNIHEKQIDELQMKAEPHKCETRPENVQPDAESRPENVQDKFAEQRKWIGKLCVFWDNDDTQEFSYGVLTKIDTESGFGVQYCCNDEYDYDDCEPVKPDDDIIYKGE